MKTVILNDRWRVMNICLDVKRRVAATIRAAEKTGMPISIGISYEPHMLQYPGMWCVGGRRDLSEFWREYEKQLAAIPIK